MPRWHQAVTPRCFWKSCPPCQRGQRSAWHCSAPSPRSCALCHPGPALIFILRRSIRSFLPPPLLFPSKRAGYKEPITKSLRGGKEGEKSPKHRDERCSCVLLTGWGCVPLPTKPWKGSGCPGMSPPGDARTVPPHPSHKNFFCCRITGQENLPYPVPATQKPPPPNILHIP